MGHDTLVVFARYPTPGKVKTRLAAGIGAEAAARLYEAFVRDLARRFSSVPYAVRWSVAPPDEGFARRFGIDPGKCRAQVGADLGARMLDAFSSHLEGKQDRCVIIGSDTPHLPRARIDEALARLSTADVVLGPAADGGYYLIAMNRPHDVFSGVTWSVASVREETRLRAEALGLAVSELDTDFDVDQPSDLARLRRRLDDPSVTCPATAEVLRELAPS